MSIFSLVLQLSSSAVLLGLGIYLFTTAYRARKSQKRAV